MTRKLLGITSVAVIAAVGFLVAAVAGDNRPPASAEKKEGSPSTAEPANYPPGKGIAAINHAAEAGKYLFLFFYQGDDDQTRAMRPVFDATMQKVADKAEGIVINSTDPAEKGVVVKFKVDRAPMPLVLALAPNGAITGGYPLKFDEQILRGAFCSRSTWECLKALQEGKLVFLCVQNKATKFSDEAMQAVRGAKADPQYANLTEIVMLDPSDQSEADAVKRLSIDPKLEEAMTILIAPPVTIVNRFKGAVAKDAILAEIKKAAAGRGGCCPGRSCGPKPPTSTQPAGTAGQPQPNVTAVKAQPGPAAARPQPGATVGKPQPGAGASVPQPQPGSSAGKP